MTSAVLQKLEEIQSAFDLDFNAKGRELVDAITMGDETKEQTVRKQIMGLHGLREQFAPVVSELRKYLLDESGDIHPEDVNLSVLAAATNVGTENQSVEFPQVGQPSLPMGTEEEEENPPPPSTDSQDLENSNGSQPEETSETSEPPTSISSPESTPAEKASKDYNKADTYKPFFLEAVHNTPGGKLADIQRKTHELMMGTKIEGVRIGREGDKERTNSGVYRYKAQTQTLRKKLEVEGLIAVGEGGSLVVTPEGDKLRWGKLKAKDKHNWAVELGLIEGETE